MEGLHADLLNHLDTDRGQTVLNEKFPACRTYLMKAGNLFRERKDNGANAPGSLELKKHL